MRVSPNIVCLSHLRWGFVYQRPQHLLGRCAREHRVLFFEPPEFGDGPARVELRSHDGVQVAVPWLPEGLTGEAALAAERALLDQVLTEWGGQPDVLWYYTPMALEISRHLRPAVTVYDCMDELSAFAFAPPNIGTLEAELLRRADLVFTGGQSLYEAKRDRHPSVHLFPSSVDAAHFGRARQVDKDPADQAAIPRPRLGYVGVIDERMDYELLASVADARPDWQIVLVGPTCKVDPAALPQRPNLHYLGGKTYQELPEYLAGWDVALLPFALNEATRFISPTKTPEYLAAGRPVVSTPIRDVVRTYGEVAGVRIAGTPDEFVEAVEAALAEPKAAWLPVADAFLAQLSWDETWKGMWGLIEGQLRDRSSSSDVSPELAEAAAPAGWRG